MKLCQFFNTTVFLKKLLSLHNPICYLLFIIHKSTYIPLICKLLMLSKFFLSLFQKYNLLQFCYRYVPRDEGKYIHIPNPYIHDGRPYEHDDRPPEPYEPYVPEATVDQYKLVLIPPNDINPYYKPGYYQNNGIKILNQKHNYQDDRYDFE